ncbi:MAG: cation:proton antiporter [Candidatus Kapabacteria bacterium]|nr:cation:proton antiporter [Candidatus Kapabacteria bacterium]
MHDTSLILDLLIVFTLSIAVVYIFNRIKIPPIVGFLLTGLLIGPNGFHLIGMEEEVDIFAEIGVILILFSIGIDFSLSKLLNLKRIILLGGSLQVFSTIAVIALISYGIGFEVNVAIFLGFLVALSSTAIILKLLISNGALDTPQGKISLGILIFQDIIILPMFLVTPLLAGMSENIVLSVVLLIAKIVGILAFLYISIQFVMPKLIFAVAKTRIKELFFFIIILIALVVVWLSSVLGISLALGAFLAGLIISESDYSHEALSFVEPMRDVFGSIFFISIGMLFDVSLVFENWEFVLLATLIVLIVKFFSLSLAVLVLGYPVRIIMLVGLMLAQIGEFSFVLSKIGLDSGIISFDIYSKVIAVAVISMLFTPLYFEFAPKIASAIGKLKIFEKYNNRAQTEGEQPKKLSNHMIIVGFGLNGRNLTKAASIAGLEYIVLEMNPITVKNEKENGEPIHYGDASNEAILEFASVKKAKILVIAISDPTSTRAIIAQAKNINPDLYIIARTRFVQEVQALYTLGADEVIPEEFETSIEIFTRVLTRYLIPRQEIERLVNDIRSDGYDMLRSISRRASYTDIAEHIPHFDVCSIRITDKHHFIGKSLNELKIRNRYELTVLAVKRGSEYIANPQADEVIAKDDILITWGERKQISEFNTDME